MEIDKEMLSAAMRLAAKSQAGLPQRERASRENGRNGGRPKGSKDRRQRTRRSKKEARAKSGVHYEAVQE